MRAGRFDEAWAMSERDVALRDPALRDDPSVDYHLRWVWDGRPFDNRDVLVRCYHGLGDTIQFARYLPALAERARSVRVEVQPRLLPLLSQTPGVTFHPFDVANPLPPVECDIEITELAFALRLSPLDVPAPYLSVAPAALPSGTIGLCYSAGGWDKERWVPPALLAPLCEGRRCLSLVAEPAPLPIANPEGCPFDFAETAALVAGCALVITVDTMIAHLAGALGRPTWLMLKSDPDWRWSPHDRRSPWYDSMRLYAQPQAGDWEHVVDRVARDLARLYPAQAKGSR
ncbi:Glycosyltransferase family 9 (heptosyltransferase) [Sphingomonas jatrophae]|uniref:Glycosyltransferase family 9 (Heptosyltransferase) n=2 Tax=Sphingomonas jatrophae TaxID=1166337 RepID=A0A1I6JFT3_9SPHN|nr:Glycosyltransferase family 9 (heptosyltransferase) [Sphingomonas jatrophae]